MSATQAYREVFIKTPFGDNVLLFHDLHGVESIGGLFEYHVNMLSENRCLPVDDILGKSVALRLLMPNGENRHFSGYVTRFSQTGVLGDYVAYNARISPWLWFLTRTSNCRIFQNKSVPDIIKEIFGEHGMTDYKESLTSSYQKREHCVQYRETDFNFVSRLMEDEGIYYFFAHGEDGKHILNLADSYGAHKPFPGYEKLPYYPYDFSQMRERDHVNEIQPTWEPQAGGYGLKDYDFEKPGMNLQALSLSPKTHTNAKFEHYDWPGGYLEPGQGDTRSAMRLDEVYAHYEQVHGRANAYGIAAGALLTIANSPRADLNREFLVKSTELRIVSNEYVSHGARPMDLECEFVLVDAKKQYRPPRVTPKPFVQGPQTAFVVGKAGEEIWTDKYGRVIVQFHWDRYSKTDEKSSCWVRVSQSWAGKGWGTIFTPRIGQEVIVEFLEGDPDRPIVTGCVYNGGSMPPYALPDKASVTAIKSNSTKGGGGFNELRFEDKKGDEQIFIHAEKDQHVRVKKDHREWIGNERHLIVKKDQFEQVDGDKHATVKGNINVESKGTVSLKTAMDLQEKVGMKHALDAGMEIHLKAGMNVMIESGLTLTLKAGASFIAFTPAGIAMSGMPMMMINSGGSAGSGSGCSPEAPKPPKEADDAEPGAKFEPPKPKPPKPVKFSPSALVLKEAAQTGAPFCEKCEEARRAAAASS
jgi:type VI secretion system secreted protein VgrG